MRANRAHPMPGWVKVIVAAAIAATALVMVAGLLGHGPWQHGAMGGMHG